MRNFSPEEDRDASINKSLEDEMKTKYSTIYYLVSIRVDSKDPVNHLEEGDTLAYFVSRDDFNRVKIEDKVEYEVSTSALSGFVPLATHLRIS